MAGEETVIACLAVLGNQPTHNPLFVRVFGERDALQFHYFVHCAVDIIEEKVQSSRGVSPAPFDKYLGYLCPIDEYKVYGYMTVSDIKFIVVVQDVFVRDSDMKGLFRWLHNLYVDTLMNPFAEPGKPITSRRFCGEVDKVIGSHENILRTRIDNASSP
ncbi:Trafficking protein particle complex subunit 2-like protein [Plasmodiophora brassicae]|uniref:Trafficking protein particle complex subunit 2-like protein n=1 Tax=Plasmodiophora brassicae TaxID=37360 RepID=A0A0G4ISZ6_PLABS|nr:hypothetical protein PBRA_006461 [Plasmodiophora brassicae]SPQ94432.1 unnamed protein product [Plasmodiophora brassicae]